MKKQYLKTTGSTLIVGAFLFLAFGSDESDSTSTSTSSKEVDCSNSKDSYNSGYSMGSLCRTMGDYSSCESFVNSYNYETGRNILVASDCYCEGFDDGADGNENKYE